MKTKTLIIALMLGLVSFWGCENNSTGSDNGNEDVNLSGQWDGFIDSGGDFNYGNHSINGVDNINIVSITPSSNSNITDNQIFVVTIDYNLNSVTTGYIGIRVSNGSSGTGGSYDCGQQISNGTDQIILSMEGTADNDTVAVVANLFNSGGDNLDDDDDIVAFALIGPFINHNAAVENFPIQLDLNYQENQISGSLIIGDNSFSLINPEVENDNLIFRVWLWEEDYHDFRGKISGNKISGSCDWLGPDYIWKLRSKWEVSR